MFTKGPNSSRSAGRLTPNAARNANTIYGGSRRLAAALLFVSSVMLGQEYSASLSVTVSDPSNALVPGAHVLLRDSQQQVVREADTSSSGGVIFASLQPRDYSLEVSKTGFDSALVSRITLRVRDQQSLVVQLKLKSVESSVTVTDTAEGISTDAATGISVDQNYIQNLPVNGRNADALILMAPGITSTAGGRGPGGGFNANGLRSNTNYYTLDGVSLNMAAGGGGPGGGPPGGPGGGPPPGGGPGGGGDISSQVSLDAMQEMRVQTSSFAPEFGRTPGAQVSMTSRGGSNDLHGSLYYYFRNERLQANDWFANSRGYGRGELRQNRPGGTLGAPIVKNKTFFFVSYERLRLITPTSIITSVPDLQTRQSAAPSVRKYLNAFPLPNGAEQTDGAAEFHAVVANPSSSDPVSLRVDHIISAQVKLFARYSLTPTSSLSQGAGFSSPNVLTQQDSHTDAGTVGLTVAGSSGSINDTRINYSRSSFLSFSTMDGFGEATPLTASSVFPSGVTSDTGQFSLSALGVGGYSFGGQNRNEQAQINVVHSFTKILGSHTIKLGADYRRIMPTNFRTPYTLNVTFNGLSGSNGALASGVATNVQIASNLPAVYPVYTNFSTYAQDTWRATDRTTLTYGLRWDINPAPGVRQGERPFALADSTIAGVTQNDPLYATRWHDVAPRFGLAYQMDTTEGREMVLRMGIGLFYDVGYGTTGAAFGGAPYSNIRTISLAVFPLAAADTAAPVLPPTRPYGQITASDKNLESPLVTQMNVTLERNFGSNQTLSVAYVGTMGRRLLRTESQPSFGDAYSILMLATNGASSDYHGLQVQLRRRLSRNLQTQVSYTWAHSIDSASSDVSFGGGFATLFGSGQRGNSDFDIRHNLSWSGSYLLWNPSKGFIGALLGNWYADWMASARTSLPFDVQGITTTTSDTGITTVNQRAGLFAQVRPDYTGAPVWISDPNAPGGRKLNPAAFAAPGSYAQGNLGRNSLRGFGFSQVDLSLRRQIAISEKWKLNFSVQAYNVFNHPSFDNPSAIGAANLSSPTFGVATQTVGGGFGGGSGSVYSSGRPRSAELSVRLQF